MSWTQKIFASENILALAKLFCLAAAWAGASATWGLPAGTMVVAALVFLKD
jgi:hypothetical protein